MNLINIQATYYSLVVSRFWTLEKSLGTGNSCWNNGSVTSITYYLPPARKIGKYPTYLWTKIL